MHDRLARKLNLGSAPLEIGMKGIIALDELRQKLSLAPTWEGLAHIVSKPCLAAGEATFARRNRCFHPWETSHQDLDHPDEGIWMGHIVLLQGG